MHNCKHSLFCEHCAETKDKIQKVIDEWRYSSYRLAVDLNNMTERDSTIRDALDKCIWDLEEALK